MVCPPETRIEFGESLIKVRFSRAASSSQRLKLFSIRKHTGELEPSLAVRKMVWFYSVEPVIHSSLVNARRPFLFHPCQCAASDWRQFHDADGRRFLVLFDILIFKPDNAPNTTAKQTVILGYIVRRNEYCEYQDLKSAS